MVAVILEYVAFGYDYVVIASTLAIGIGAYRLTISSTKDFQDFLLIINDNAHTKENQSNKLKTLFAEYVDTHATMKQLSINPVLNRKEKRHSRLTIDCSLNFPFSGQLLKSFDSKVF